MPRLSPLPKLPKLAKKGREAGARCAVCQCQLHGSGVYATPTVEGRSHATDHHFVARRIVEARVFETCPWGLGNQTVVCCYECHEVLLHNPVFTDVNLAQFSQLVAARGLTEDEKPPTGRKLGGRIQLLQEVIAPGLRALSKRGHPNSLSEDVVEHVQSPHQPPNVVTIGRTHPVDINRTNPFRSYASEF